MGWLIVASLFFFTTGGMAAHTVFEVANALFAMFAFDLGRVVFVTAVAGVAAQAARVAGLAGITSVAVVEGETVPGVISGWQPGIGIVAGAAVGGEQSLVVSGV